MTPEQLCRVFSSEQNLPDDLQDFEIKKVADIIKEDWRLRNRKRSFVSQMRQNRVAQDLPQRHASDRLSAGRRDRRVKTTIKNRPRFRRESTFQFGGLEKRAVRIFLAQFFAAGFDHFAHGFVGGLIRLFQIRRAQIFRFFQIRAGESHRVNQGLLGVAQ